MGGDLVLGVLNGFKLCDMYTGIIWLAPIELSDYTDHGHYMGTRSHFFRHPSCAIAHVEAKRVLGNRGELLGMEGVMMPSL